MSDARGQLVAPDARALLRMLRTGGPKTRAQLAELTGLARSTVSARLEGLLSSGLAVPAGDESSTGGRPPALVAFNPAARVVLAVDLGATHGVVALTDLAGSILHTESRELAIASGPEPVLDWAIAAAKRVLTASGRARTELVGIGVGLPGPVEHASGLPTNPPIMPGWNRFDVPGYVGRHFDVPVLVDNDVNVLALGEHAVTWPDVTDMVFVKVSTGIGAGIISGGRLQRGAQGSAGDLGHVRVPFTRRTPQHGAEDADLEALASGPAIAAWMTERDAPALTSQDVMEAGLRGDPLAVQGLRQAGRDLGEVLATVVNLLNPSVVVIGGSVARAGEHLLAGVREVVYGQSTPLATQNLSIVHSRAGATGGVLGAAIMVIQRVLDEASA
ncbi:ROK family transcriptional regulator [Gryllotalpicola protaetiae]|uniref:ROK family transcriptional regulator n=1 Tax=Gryllotalpicola protaetiae TaxID=2419771 RepID=A0A387BPN6_9MICO|nr:ROK family transcriptional regulator [Gryllotalpicola protaetiae]AYG04014.1 ROK family transcriptional regulator [Gryllotalpicola protaetiae]